MESVTSKQGRKKRVGSGVADSRVKVANVCESAQREADEPVTWFSIISWRRSSTLSAIKVFAG